MYGISDGETEREMSDCLYISRFPSEMRLFLRTLFAFLLVGTLNIAEAGELLV